jgi:hypothetical protein
MNLDGGNTLTTLSERGQFIEVGWDEYFFVYKSVNTICPLRFWSWYVGSMYTNGNGIVVCCNKFG